MRVSTKPPSQWCLSTITAPAGSCGRLFAAKMEAPICPPDPSYGVGGSCYLPKTWIRDTVERLLKLVWPWDCYPLLLFYRGTNNAARATWSISSLTAWLWGQQSTCAGNTAEHKQSKGFLKDIDGSCLSQVIGELMKEDGLLDLILTKKWKRSS